MENRFDIVKELRKYTGQTHVSYAVRYGKKHFFTIEQAYQDVTKRKVRLLCEYLKNRGLFVRRSKSSESLYFSIRGITFRISDHKSNYTEMITYNIVVRYDTCVIQTVNYIQLLAFIPDNYEG